MGNLAFFMKDDLLKEEIVEVPGLDTFKDDKGNVIPFKIKKLRTDDVNRIRKAYMHEKMIMENKKKPLVVNGQVQYKKEYDDERATDHLIVEAMEFPKLDDPELMAFYGVVDKVDMPKKLFGKMDDYNYVSTTIIKVLGFDEEENGEEAQKEQLETAKN